MKRLGRWLFNFAAAVSLMLWLGCVSLWVMAPRIDYQWSSGRIFDRITLRGGGIVYFRLILEPAPPTTNQPGFGTLATLWRIHVLGAGLDKERVIFHTASGQRPFSIRYNAYIKLALAAVVLAGLPIWWIATALRAVRRRNLPGFCAVCGYDLRATPERCPECGTVSLAANKVGENRTLQSSD